MNSNATKRVAYISLRLYEDAKRPETKKFRTRVCSFDSDHLCTVIKKGVRTYLDEINPEGDVDDNAVDSAIRRIRKMTCGTTDPGAMNLVQFIDDPHATLALLELTFGTYCSSTCQHASICRGCDEECQLNGSSTSSCW
mmetsp:Transcript_17998/g.36129  ORF Transcript_17998/g.36129 Transcript_17998/m.36129 type:complete len:139 (-) Transcript_17998:1347-1763(-)